MADISALTLLLSSVWAIPLVLLRLNMWTCPSPLWVTDSVVVLTIVRPLIRVWPQSSAVKCPVLVLPWGLEAQTLLMLPPFTMILL